MDDDREVTPSSDAQASSSSEAIKFFFPPNVDETIAPLVYIENFITPDEEEFLLSAILTKSPASAWTQLKRRRLQNIGGTPNSKGMFPTPMPDWIKGGVGDRVNDSHWLSKSFNHVLVNEYEPGCGIMPHEDGPVYEPVVVIVSIGSSVSLSFSRKTLEDSGEQEGVSESGEDVELPDKLSVFLQPRSVVVFRGLLYSKYLHHIAEVNEDIITPEHVNAHACGVNFGDAIPRGVPRPQRISITYRVVKKVLSASLLKAVQKR